MAKQKEMADSMHYESRQIRDALAASDARLKVAKTGRLAADLQPQQGTMMLQEWQGLAAMGDLDHGNSLASDNPQFQQMRAALLTFERDLAYVAPARERAFFSALRAQLMEASVQPDEEQRNMHIAATFKWFSRHKPQGPEDDPITAAVLASSLSVEAVAPPAPGAYQYERLPSAQGLLPSGHSRSAAAPPQMATGPSGSGAFAAIGPGTQVKHQFFDVYSKASIGPGVSASGSSMSGGAAGASVGPGRPPSARGASTGLRAGGRSAESPPSLSVNHPLVMHPTVAPGASGARLQPAAAVPAAASSTVTASQPRARFISTELYAPAKLVRPQELDELDHRAASQAAAAATAASGGGSADGAAGRVAASLHSRPWIPGPHKATNGTGGAFVGKGGPSGSRPKATDEDAALRERWVAMDAKASRSVADVQSKVAEWTLQRARLEEEIVRRQEAARFAPSSGGGAASHWRNQTDTRRPDTDDGSLPPGTLSPYANANADLAAATAAAATTSLVPGGASSVNFLLQPSTGGGAAGAIGASMRMRHAEIGNYDRNRSDLLTRMYGLGVPVSSETLDRALRPVEDRPFLDCISKLPKPGDHLVSRPGSVRGAAGAGGKKKRGKSASKSRPTSGK